MKKVSSELCRVYGDVILPNKHHCWSSKTLQIPASVPSRLDGCQLIDVKYELQVSGEWGRIEGGQVSGEWGRIEGGGNLCRSVGNGEEGVIMGAYLVMSVITYSPVGKEEVLIVTTHPCHV